MNREKTTSPGCRLGYSREIYTRESLLERLLGRISETRGGEGLKALDALLVLLRQLLRERFSLSAEEIERDAKNRAAAPDHFFIQRGRTISVYAAELVRLMRETSEGIQSAFQIVLDQAVEDLAARRSDAMLTAAKDRLEGRLPAMIEPADKSRDIGGVAVDTTRWPEPGRPARNAPSSCSSTTWSSFPRSLWSCRPTSQASSSPSDGRSSTATRRPTTPWSS